METSKTPAASARTSLDHEKSDLHTANSDTIQPAEESPRSPEKASDGEKASHGAGPAAKPPSDSEDEGMTGLPLLAVMTGLTLGSFLMLLDTTILATAIPSITSRFHSLPDVGWYGAAYQLANAACQPLSGKFYASFNTKWTYAVFIAVFELGSLLSAAASSSDMFIVGRAVAGIGASGIQNGAFTIIAGCVPLHRRPGLIGLLQGVAQFGLVIGPLVGGALTEYVSWRWCFYINLPCGAVVGAALLWVRIPEQVAKPPAREVWRDLHNRVDLVGFVLFAPACVMLLMAVQWGGNRYPWDSGVVIGLLVGAGVDALVWLAWDWYRGDAAMVPLSLVRRRNVWAGSLTFCFLMGPLFCAAYYLPIYFQSVKNVGASLSGVYLLPSIASQLVMAVAAGRLLQRVGYYLPFSLVSSILMSVGYGMLTTLSPHTATSQWVGYQLLFGLGRGMGIQMPLVAIQANLPPAQIPVAMGLAFFVATLGGALTLSFSDTIFTNSLRGQLRDSLSPSTVTNIVNSGGTGFRQLVTPSQLPHVLSAYCVGIDRVFYLQAAWTAVGFFTGLGMGWKDIRKKKPVSKV